jgi:hypothetical protein
MSKQDDAPADLTTAALVEPRHQHLFDKAIEKGTGGSDVGAYNFLHTCPASHGDRLVLELAYACKRGYGPAIAIDQLQGMEPKVAERVLAGLALAMGAQDAPALLAKAAERCQALLPEPEASEEG